MQAIQAEVGRRLEQLEAAAMATRAGVTHEEARAENPKDTRAIEASYLARGQARRVEEMREIATRLRSMKLRSFSEDDAIDASAVVTVDVDDEQRTFFIVPAGGGITTSLDGTEIQLLTARSPLGRAILGLREGDDVEVRVAKRTRDYEIVRVQ